MTAPVIVITGTDTEVGKTLVTAALARALRDRGVDVVAVKPVESGTDHAADGGAEDGVLLARATGQAHPPEALTRLPAPVAPPLAADLAGVVLDPQGWRDEIEDLRELHELVLVEGAGGLLSPLTWDLSLRELIAGWDAGVVVVAADRLGALNHTALTLEALTGREIHAVVLSARAGATQNATSLRRLHPDVRVLELPRVPDWTAAVPRLAELAARLDPLSL